MEAESNGGPAMTLEPGPETDARVSRAMGIPYDGGPEPPYSTDSEYVGAMLEWVAERQYGNKDRKRVCVAQGWEIGWIVAHEKWNTINDFIVSEPTTLNLACCAAVLAVKGDSDE